MCICLQCGGACERVVRTSVLARVELVRLAAEAGAAKSIWAVG